jgi:large subunit ribosomal protein L22
MTPRKVRLVADLVRGLSANEAEAQLVMQRRRAAKPLLKLLRSAIANAKQNGKTNIDTLYVQSIEVNQGPMLKRYLPRARGSASPIEKKMSHVTLTLLPNAKINTSRFTITPHKKVKKNDDNVARSRKEKPQMDDERVQKEKTQSGFFKKVFSRKSGMGK